MHLLFLLSVILHGLGLLKSSHSEGTESHINLTGPSSPQRRSGERTLTLSPDIRAIETRL